MEKEIKILSFAVEKVLVSKDNQSIKALLKLQDKKIIETESAIKAGNKKE